MHALPVGINRSNWAELSVNLVLTRGHGSLLLDL
jgi:hypothetical protein